MEKGKKKGYLFVTIKLKTSGEIYKFIVRLSGTTRHESLFSPHYPRKIKIIRLTRDLFYFAAILR